MAVVQGFAPVLAGALVIGAIISGVESIGVCNGMVGDDLPSPRDVVQLYKSSGISNMRIFTPDGHVMDALRGSGIGLVLGADNSELPGLAASQANAAAWVRTNVLPYHPDVKIMYIAVGNEVKDDVAQSILLPAMQNLEGALAAAGLGGIIKVSMSVSMNVITNSFPPSQGTFAQPYMAGIARFLATTGAPLLANVYPYYAYKKNQEDISLAYATFQPGATTVRDPGNGLTYTNLFDAMVDAVYAALEKADAPNVGVVVSESGWPSAGGFAASVDNARTYVQGLINHIPQGTPKKPGAMEVFVFAMFNENQKTGNATERNFGLFYPNKSPVYPVTFS